MRWNFEGQVIIVTGAAGALGGAVAEAFRAAGGNVVLVDSREDRLAARYPDLVDSPHALICCTDLTDEADVQRMAEQALDRYGRVDTLVNVAGGFVAGAPLHETTLDQWQRMLNLNARTVFLCARAVTPIMLAQSRGKIINIAARAALQGAANQAAYSASKSAVVRLTESMAEELRDRGINVNCVLPGTLDTPGNRAANPGADASRWVALEQLAQPILFLASDAAQAVHGAALPVVGLS